MQLVGGAMKPWGLPPTHSQSHVATECDLGPAALHLGMSKAVVLGAGVQLVFILGDAGGRLGQILS